MSRKQAWIVGPVALLYTALLVLAGRMHTFWRDEAEVWIIARDSGGLHQLLRNIRYEGHPPAWYALNAVIAHFTWNIEWMKVTNGLFSVLAIILILAATRVRLLIRLGLVFSYGMLFEYSVINRNYMMGITLLLATVHVMKRRGAIYWVPALLSLAALSSLPAMILAVCLYPLHLWHEFRQTRRLPAQRWAAAAVFAASVLLAVSIARPPKDSGLLLDGPLPGSLTVTLLHPFHNLSKGYLPPPPLKVQFWDKNLIDMRSPALSTVIGIALAVGLIFFFRRREVRAFFLTSSALLLVELAISRRTEARHVGWLFVAFIIALLLDELPWLSSDNAAERGWRPGLLYGVLAVQVVSGVFAIGVSLFHPFSASKQAADFLRDHGLTNEPMVFAPGFTSMPILAYLRRADGYLLERHAQGAVIQWDLTELYGRHMPSLAELQAASVNGVMPVLVTEVPLTDAQRTADHLHLLAAFHGDIDQDAYYIYR